MHVLSVLDAQRSHVCEVDAALYMDLTESEQPTSPCRSTSPYKNVYFSRNIMGHILRRDSIIYWSGYSMKALSKGMGI